MKVTANFSIDFDVEVSDDFKVLDIADNDEWCKRRDNGEFDGLPERLMDEVLKGLPFLSGSTAQLIAVYGANSYDPIMEY